MRWFVSLACALLLLHGSDALASTLWDAVQRLAARHRITVLVDDDAREPLSRPAVAQAPAAGDLASSLRTLFANSELTWEWVDATTLKVRAASSVSLQLDTLRVEGLQPPHAMQDRALGIDPSFDWRRQPEAQVLSGAALQSAGADRIGALLRRAPNVSGSGPSLSVRGIERGQGTLATTEIRLDELPLTTASLRRSLLPPVLDSVLFQRGPRTAIDSFGGLAGAISIRTPRPAPTSASAYRAALSTDGGHSAAAVGQHGLPALGLSGALQLGLSRTPVGIRLMDGVRSPDARASVVHGRSIWEPDAWPALTGELALLIQDATPGLQRVVTPPGTDRADPDALISTESRPSRTVQRNAAARAALQIEAAPDLMLRLSMLGAEGNDLLQRASNVQGEVLSREDDESLRSLTAGFRWHPTKTLWLRGEWTLTHRESFTRDRVSSPLEAFFPGNADVSTEPATRRELSIVAGSDDRSQAPMVALGLGSPGLGAELGLRHHRSQRWITRSVVLALDQSDCILRIGSVFQPCQDEFPTSRSHSDIPFSEHSWLPLLRGWWSPADAHLLSLSARRGLLPGGARLEPTSGEVVAYRAERSDSIDIGYRFEPNGWQFGATVFLNRWSDRQVREELPGQQGFLVRNAGRAEAYGGELTLHWQSEHGIEAWAGLGFLRTRYLSDSALRDEAFADIAGNQFPGAPRITANAGASASVDGWRISLALWHSAAAFSDAGNTPAGRRPAHRLLDLRVERQMSARLRSFLSVENLLDTAYVEDIRTGVGGRGVLEFVPGEPRRVMFGLSWDWH